MKMTNIFTGAVLGAVLSVAGTAAQSGEVPGFSRISLDMAHRDTTVRGAIWYPVGTGGEARLVGENAVFFGVPVLEDATIAEGRHPVILLSHGLGGRFSTIAWLPAGLAARGAIVVSVNHPKSTTSDFDIRKAIYHWTRARDLQGALNHLLSDALWMRNVDESRIMAAGFSYGGWTALSMGGVTSNRDGYVAYCETYRHQAADCLKLASAGIDLLDLDAERWNSSYKDARIAAVAAIEPALTHGLSSSNVKNLVGDVLLIGLGAGADRYLATDFSPSGSGFSGLLPHARVVVIAPARRSCPGAWCKSVALYAAPGG